jgi:hypothetical protein
LLKQYELSEGEGGFTKLVLFLLGVIAYMFITFLILKIIFALIP